MKIKIGMPEIMVICSVFYWQANPWIGGILLVLGILCRTLAFSLEYQQKIETSKKADEAITDLSEKLATMFTGGGSKSSFH